MDWKLLSYKELEDKPGIFLLIFPNGKKYIGCGIRIKSSIEDIYYRMVDILNLKVNKWDWYCNCFEYFYNEFKDLNYFFLKTKFFIQYTETYEKARILKKWTLHDVYHNNETEQYYNKTFYKLFDRYNKR